MIINFFIYYRSIEKIQRFSPTIRERLNRFIWENNLKSFPYIIPNSIPVLKPNNNINNHLKFSICTSPNCTNLTVCLEPQEEICGQGNDHFHGSPRTELHYHCQQPDCDFVYYPIYANMDYGYEDDVTVIIGLSDHKHCDVIIDGKICPKTTHHYHCTDNDYDEAEDYSNSSGYIKDHPCQFYSYSDSDSDSDYSDSDSDSDYSDSYKGPKKSLIPDPYKQQNPHMHCDYRYNDEKCLTNQIHSHCPVEGCDYLYESIRIPKTYDIYGQNNHCDVIVFQELDAESQDLIKRFFKDNWAMYLFDEANLSKSLAQIYEKLNGKIPATILDSFRFKRNGDILKQSRLNNLRYCTSYHVHCPDCPKTDFHYHCNMTLSTTKMVNKKPIVSQSQCTLLDYHTHCIYSSYKTTTATACTEDDHFHCDKCHYLLKPWSAKYHQRYGTCRPNTTDPPSL